MYPTAATCRLPPASGPCLVSRHRVVAQLLETTALPAHPQLTWAIAAPASGSLGYGAWIWDEGLRSSCPSTCSGTAADQASAPLGAG